MRPSEFCACLEIKKSSILLLYFNVWLDPSFSWFRNFALFLDGPNNSGSRISKLRICRLCRLYFRCFMENTLKNIYEFVNLSCSNYLQMNSLST